MNKTKQEVLKKFSLDAETKRLMAGIYPASAEFTVTFTPDCFKAFEEKLRPKFLLIPYSMKEMRDLASKTEILKDEELDEYANSMIRKKIVGMSNLIDMSTEEVIKFEEEDGHMSKEQYDKLPMLLRTEIMKELSSISSGIRS